MTNISPMMKQYLNIKEKHKDTIVFFRLGDFYEMFFDDAILASKELELTLTGRDCGLDERAPMCGVPHHSSEAYIARLIAKGYKVAICEQKAVDPNSKGIVDREVVRIITPGTVIESSMLSDEKNNYIGSVYIEKNTAGISFADVSTGVCHTSLINDTNLDDAIIAEISRFVPKELLVNGLILEHTKITDYIKQSIECAVELLEDNEHENKDIKGKFASQFGKGYENADELTSSDVCYASIYNLITYLENTQKKGVDRLKIIDFYSTTEFMKLSPVTRINLELTETMRGREKKGTLLWVLDKTQTAMGKRLIRSWVEQPLFNTTMINNRLEGTGEFYEDSMLRADLIEALAGIFDIERLMTRIIYGSANPKEVYALASTCEKLPVISDIISKCSTNSVKAIGHKFDVLQDLMEKIVSSLEDNPSIAIKDGGVIRRGYSEEVDQLRDIVGGGKGFLVKLETKLREETGISKLKIGYNRVFGYYIEISRLSSDKVPEHFIRKQTLANAERYITDELKQLENTILGANERLVIIEKQLFDDLLGSIAKDVMRVQSTASAIAELDVLCSFAQVAVKNNYTKPYVVNDTILKIEQGRHPVVEIISTADMFVPNDTELDCDENRMMIITGPNMAGKSTYMRQTALICLMAQIGSFVPAKSAHIGTVDSIFTRVGASDDLSAGKSTFMVEMTEVAQILEKATCKSLVVLDEIGRGTSTYDGMSIARAVAEHIMDKSGNLGCKTLFATHYHELTDLEQERQGVKNYSVCVKKRGDEITFLRRIIAGPADDSYGIEVSKLAGLPESVITRAKEILRVLEEGSDKVPVKKIEPKTEIVQQDTEVMDMIKKLDVDTLTPLEALNTLYLLKKKSSN